MRLLPIPMASALAAAILVSGCALGHTMKTVETAPKGAVRNTFGVTAWVAHDVATEPASGEPERQMMIGSLYNLRVGIADNAEVGFSMDVIWPGVGGKIRLNDWAALDANMKLKLPMWENNPPLGPIFDAALILGNATQSFGFKLLSHGVMPGVFSQDEPEVVLFYGFRRGTLLPEVAYFSRQRGVAVGLGFLLDI